MSTFGQRLETPCNNRHSRRQISSLPQTELNNLKRCQVPILSVDCTLKLNALKIEHTVVPDQLLLYRGYRKLPK
jgi:hypothetical protein